MMLGMKRHSGDQPYSSLRQGDSVWLADDETRYTVVIVYEWDNSVMITNLDDPRNIGGLVCRNVDRTAIVKAKRPKVPPKLFDEHEKPY
jgi:hypothetical protein